VLVTLAYLNAKDDPALWKSFRVYGAGQAKLAALKLDQANSQPLSISLETLTEIANEDMWEEFVDIDLGHWAKADLRSLSIEGGTKDEYDRFYPWTSAWSHGHWSPVRHAVFDTCGNPLHRLHRILRDTPRSQLDVVPDAVALVDRIMTLVDREYPPFGVRLAVEEG
jgi:hypothetical protein